MIDKKRLRQTAIDMIGPGKVILAMDESQGTMTKRLEEAGSDFSKQEEWRELIVTTENLEGIGAAILWEGTVLQEVNGKPVYQVLADRGIVPGVKLDTGKHEVIGHYKENLTVGLDNLHVRLGELPDEVRFAKWRAELKVSDRKPSRMATAANAYALGVFAHVCQEYGRLPIVEPEILIKGDHDIDRAYQVAQQVLYKVFEVLDEMGVYLPGTILKPSFVTPGDKCRVADAKEVADATIECFLEGNLVPTDLGGISHLSGGLTDLDSALYLNAENSEANRARAPWMLSGSFGRALIGEALTEYGGDPARIATAQAIISGRANACGLAREGRLPAEFNYKLTANR